MSAVISVKSVITAHDEILACYGGLAGFAQRVEGGLISALQRIENHILYGETSNLFEIAALYGIALVCTLTYLHQYGISIPVTPDLEQVMVDIATGDKDYLWFAQYLASLAQSS